MTDTQLRPLSSVGAARRTSIYRGGALALSAYGNTDASERANCIPAPGRRNRVFAGVATGTDIVGIATSGTFAH